MKILHIMPSYIPAYDFGGPVKAVHELCAALAEKGMDISVFTTNVTLESNSKVIINKPQYIDGVKVTYFPVAFPKSYSYSRQLSEAIKKQISEFDIVHIHAIYRYTTFIAARLCQRHNKPYLLNPFGALDPSMIKLKSHFQKLLYIKLIESRAVNNAKAVHVASRYEKENFESLGFKAPAVIIPRGIDLSKYSDSGKSEDLRKKYPELSGKKVILFLGRVHPKKGLDLLAKAFKEIVNKRDDTFLIIAGSGDKRYVSKIEDLFRKKGLSERVLFTGMLLGPDKLSAFYGSDLFVLPSYGENFGIAVLEAMACALPVIVSDRVGIHPDIESHNAGIVTKCGHEEIAQAILKLLEDNDLCKRTGINGRKLAEESFNYDKIADRMIEVYKEILQK